MCDTGPIFQSKILHSNFVTSTNFKIIRIKSKKTSNIKGKNIKRGFIAGTCFRYLASVSYVINIPVEQSTAGKHMLVYAMADLRSSGLGCHGLMRKHATVETDCLL